jgi:hypothetical protein
MLNLGIRQIRSATSLAGVAFLVGLLTSLPALAQCIPVDFPANWLDEQEELGGHTLEQHVNVNDANVLQRYNDGMLLSGSSRYTDLATAQQHIVAALENLSAVYVAWGADILVPNNSRLAFTTDRAAVVGVGVYAVLRQAQDADIQNEQRIVTVMKKIANGDCILLTSFPVP